MEKTLTKKPFYKVGHVYSFTLNPDDNGQFKGKPDRFLKFKALMRDLFLCFSAQDIDYVYHYDISMPTKINGNFPRLHLHGALRFRTNKAIQFFLLIWMARISTNFYMDIDTCEDLEIWIEYCSKCDHITGSHAKSNNINNWKMFLPAEDELENLDEELSDYDA